MVSVKTDRNWFAMRATYGRNLMAQRLLEVQKIESFVPMCKRTTRVGRRIKSDMVPVVRDLIFVCGEREVVQEAKEKIPYLHYITQPIGIKLVAAWFLNLCKDRKIIYVCAHIVCLF